MVAIAIYVLETMEKFVDFEPNTEEYLMLAVRILLELEMITVIFSVPISYVFGMIVHCCCGVKQSRDMEMNYLSQSAYH